jgi:adenine-specific DNA-methyltransferase
MIKYLGSKRLLLPLITEVIHDLAPPPATVLDLFSGTSRVGHALKARGYRVLANDHNAYAHALACCYVQADAEDVLLDASRLVREFNGLTGRAGYFTETFCIRSRFVHPQNGERVDAVREAIARKGLPQELEAVMLTSLMEAADRVDSTTGVQMAYLKSWAPRAHKPLELRVPAVLPRAAAGKGRALRMDAADAARAAADIAYIDPPYNQHSYLGNYHVWESLVAWDKPEVYGAACKRVDVRERASVFNSRRSFAAAFQRLIHEVAAPYLVVSFNDEGFLPPQEALAVLSAVGNVRVFQRDYKRYVGAQIGIYNPQGQRVGKVGHLRNREMLFVVTRGSTRPEPSEAPAACGFHPALTPAP